MGFITVFSSEEQLNSKPRRIYICTLPTYLEVALVEMSLVKKTLIQTPQRQFLVKIRMFDVCVN
jgi:hypothetical protein